MMVIVERIFTQKDNHSVWIGEKEKGYKMLHINHACNLTTQEDEARGLQVQDQLGYTIKKEIREGGEVRGSRKISVHNYLLL